MAVQAERTPEDSAARSERWSFELIDLSRPLTVETVDALFGDLVSEGRNAYSRAASPRTSAAATWAPSSAKRRAVAWPMPEPAPVTSATLPARRPPSSMMRVMERVALFWQPA